MITISITISFIIFIISVYHYRNKKIAFNFIKSTIITIICFFIMTSYAIYQQDKREYLATIYGFKLGLDMPKNTVKGKSFDLLFKEVDFQGVAGDRATNKRVDAIYMKKDFINEYECPIAFKKQWKLLKDKYPAIAFTRKKIDSDYYSFQIKPYYFKMRCNNKRLEVLADSTGDRSLDEAFYYGLIR